MKYSELKDIIDNCEGENLEEIIEIVFDEVDELELYHHCEEVANMSSEIASNYGLDEDKVYIAGLLHDVGKLIDQDDFIAILDNNNVRVSEDKKSVPSVLHSDISVLICKDLFHIDDEEILSAVESHTTLKPNASEFEKIVFLADKLTWTFEDLVFLIEETVMYNLNSTCKNTLEWLINDLESKNYLILEDTKKSYDHFKSIVL